MGTWTIHKSIIYLAAGSHVLCGKHGRVRGCLIAVSLNLHPAGHADHGLPPRQVGDVLQARDSIQSTAHTQQGEQNAAKKNWEWYVTGTVPPVVLNPVVLERKKWGQYVFLVVPMRSP